MSANVEQDPMPMTSEERDAVMATDEYFIQDGCWSVESSMNEMRKRLPGVTDATVLTDTVRAVARIRASIEAFAVALKEQTRGLNAVRH